MGSPKKKVHTGRLHKEQINLLKAETELKKLLANLKASHNQLAVINIIIITRTFTSIVTLFLITFSSKNCN